MTNRPPYVMFARDANSCYYQTNTKNKTFIKMALVLKKMGNKNHMFCLALKQKELADVDPHDEENIDEDTAIKIAYECKINPWYYFREVVRIPRTGGSPVRFKLNRANMSLIWNYYNNINVFLTHPRQTGKTISTQTIVSHVMYIAGYNYTIAMMTKERALVTENVLRLKDIRDTLPSYLVKKTRGLQGDSDNKEGLTYTVLKNKYMTFVAQDEARRADKIARGQTTATQHWDEFAYFKNNHISYAAAAPALVAAGANAIESGQPTCKIITTTAGMLDSAEGAYANKVKNNCIIFHESFYDVEDLDTLNDLIQKGSQNNMVYICYSYAQMGYTREWLEQCRRENESTDEAFARDYLNEWLSGKDNSIITPERMAIINESIKDPSKITYENGYIVKWYLKDHETIDSLLDKPLIIGLDSSDNVGKDFTALVGIDPLDMSVKFTCRCNETNTVKLASHLAEMMIRFRRTILIPERKSTGTMIIELVSADLRAAGFTPARRIFNQYVQCPEDFKANLDSLEITGRTKRNFGYVTAASGRMGRERLYKDTLMKVIEMNATRINDETIASEIRGLTVKNNRLDHGDGANDDTLFAYLLACYFVYFAKNLHEYGVKTSEFLGGVSGEAESADAERQLAIKESIDELKAKMESEPNAIIKRMYSRKIDSLRAHLKEDVNMSTAVTVEQKNIESGSGHGGRKRSITADDFYKMRIISNMGMAA